MTDSGCSCDGGFCTADGGWECSNCGRQFASFDAWGVETGNEASVAAVRAAIEADMVAEGLVSS